MNKIAELFERMRSIPDKEKRASQIEGMKTVRDKMRTAADSASLLREQGAALAVIKEADFAEKVRLSLTQASSSAAALKKRYDQGSVVDLGRADTALIQINERLEQGASAAVKGWRSLIDEQVRRYKPLAEAAERASLPGAGALRDATLLIEGWREDVPATRRSAELYLTHSAQVPVSIASLGLEGKAGKFIIDAANGRAKARDLQDADVLSFLESHPAVWTMLKVSL